MRLSTADLPMFFEARHHALAERLLPNPPLTTDQVAMLEEGQFGNAGPAAEILGFRPGPLSAGLAAYLAPRAGGIADRRP